MEWFRETREGGTVASCVFPNKNTGGQIMFKQTTTGQSDPFGISWFRPKSWRNGRSFWPFLRRWRWIKASLWKLNYQFISSEIRAKIFHVPRTFFFGLEGSWGQPLGRISRLPEQMCLFYTLIALQQHSPLSRRFYPFETGWAEDAWLQWLYKNWYYHLDISRWLNCKQINEKLTTSTAWRENLFFIEMKIAIIQ